MSSSHFFKALAALRSLACSSFCFFQSVAAEAGEDETAALPCGAEKVVLAVPYAALPAWLPEAVPVEPVPVPAVPTEGAEPEKAPEPEVDASPEAASVPKPLPFPKPAPFPEATPALPGATASRLAMASCNSTPSTWADFSR